MIRPPIAAAGLTGGITPESRHAVLLGVGWNVERHFPADPSVLDASRWLDVFTRYRFTRRGPTYPCVFRAPSVGRVQLLPHRGRVVLAFLPLHGSEWLFDAGNVFAPHGNALIMHSDYLQIPVHQRELVAWLINQNLIDHDRGLRLEESSGGLTQAELIPLTEAERVWNFWDGGDRAAARAEAERQAVALAPDIVEGWLGPSAPGNPMMVRQDAFLRILALDQVELDVGWAHVPMRPNATIDIDAPWIWFDVDEVFRRLDHTRTVEPRFDFRDDRRDGERIRAWYERTTALQPNRIRRISTADLDLFNPPPSPEMIPDDVLFLRPSTEVEVHTTSTSSTWHKIERVAEGFEPTTSHLGDALDSGDTATISLTPPVSDDIDLDGNPDLEPFRVVIATNALQSLTLRAFPSVLAAADQAAWEVNDEVEAYRRMVDGHHAKSEYLDPAHYHEDVSNRLALALADAQEALLVRVPATARDRLQDKLEDDSGVRTYDRREHILGRRARHETALTSKAERLNALFTSRLFQEATSLPTEVNWAIVDRVMTSMGLTHLGRQRLDERLSGFYDDREFPHPFDHLPSPQDPIFTITSFSRLFSLYGSIRTPLAATFMKAAEPDLRLRTLNRLQRSGGGSVIDRAALIAEIRSEIEEKIGGRLRCNLVRNGTFSGPDGERIPHFVFQDSMEHAPSESAQAALRRASAVNVLNAFGRLVVLALNAAQYADDPSATNLLFLTSAVQAALETALPIAEVAGAITQGHPAFDLFTGLKTGVGAAGVVLAGLTLANTVAGRGTIDANGDSDALLFTDIGILAQSASLITSSAALLGATGPIGWTVGIVAALVALGAGVAAASLTDTPLEADFAHTLFGDNYPAIAQTGSSPAHPAMRDDINNLRADLYRSLTTQISQMNGYLFPLRATVTRPSLHHVHISMSPTAIRENSLVVVQIWDASQTPLGRVSGYFSVRSGRVDIRRLTTDLGYAEISESASGRWQIDIHITASLTPYPDHVAVTVTFGPPAAPLAAAVDSGDSRAVVRAVMESSASARTIMELP